MVEQMVGDAQQALTPALPHPMGEGEPFPTGLTNDSPSPIGWERAGVRASVADCPQACDSFNSSRAAQISDADL